MTNIASLFLVVLVPILCSTDKCWGAEELVSLSVSRHPNGKVILTLRNDSRTPVVVDGSLQLPISIVFVDKDNTIIPLREISRKDAWTDGDRKTRLLVVAPGGSVNRELDLSKPLWNFRSATAIPDGQSFVYESETVLPDAAKPVRMIVSYGIGRHRDQIAKYTGLEKNTLGELFNGELKCSLELEEHVQDSRSSRIRFCAATVLYSGHPNSVSFYLSDS